MAEDTLNESGEQLYSDLRLRWSDAKALQKPCPSEYEKLRSDKERGLLGLPDQKTQNFEARPQAVVFEGNRDSVALVLFNRSTATHSLSLKPFHSSWLQITGMKKIGQRIAQGMEAVVNLHCTTMGKSATTQLTFITDDGEIHVPVNAIGPRSRLDIPDEFDVGESLAKMSTQRKLVLRNKGDVTVLFAMHADRPFTVSPHYVLLPPGGRTEVWVGFEPKKRGRQTGELVLLMDSGELVGIKLSGTCSEAKARLDINTLAMPDTLIGQKTACHVVFRNWSDTDLRYRWSNNCMPEMDDTVMEESIDELSATFKARLSTLSTSFPPGLHSEDMGDHHTLQRELEDQSQLVRADPPVFASDTFKISPLSGVLLSQKLHEFKVEFAPSSINTQMETAYMEVEGFQDRIALTITGKSVGANLVPSCRAMDLGHIMVNETNTFEVQLENKSEIAGTYHVELPSGLGKDLQVTPLDGTIEPFQLTILLVHLAPSRIGDFNETISILVENSNCNIDIKLHAVVTGPILHFTPHTIDFGTTAIGFREERQVVLTNTSSTDIRFSLNLKELGNGKKDFEVEERMESFLGGRDSCEIMVRYCSTELGLHKALIELTVADIPDPMLHLSLMGICEAPVLKLMPSVLKSHLCFLGVDYDQAVQLVNDSSLPLIYSIPEQEEQESQDIVWSCQSPKGIVEAASSCQVIFTARVQRLGPQSTIVNINVLGHDVPSELTIECIGQGPIISASPSPPADLNWGKIEVLKAMSKNITFRNESRIVAQLEFQVETALFQVDKAKVTIEPSCSADVNIAAFLSDTKKFTDILSVSVMHGKMLQYPLTAIGYGTTLRLNPSLPFLAASEADSVTMRPIAKFKSGVKALSIDTKAELAAGLQVHKLDLESQYCHSEHAMVLEISNDGDRQHDCSVSTWGFAPSRIHHLRMAAAENGNTAKCGNMDALPCFRVEPDKFIIYPHDAVQVNLIGFSDSARRVQERLLIQAIAGKSLVKEKVMSIDVCCDFTEPTLRIEPEKLDFEVTVTPGMAVSEVHRNLSLHNVTQLPIATIAVISYPFGIKLAEQEECVPECELVIEPASNLDLLVFFDPAYKKDCFSRSISQKLTLIFKDSLETKTISLSGKVNFPNLDVDRTMIDFGYVAWHTGKAECITLTNNSLLPAAYHWYLMVEKGDDGDDEGFGSESSEEEELEAASPRQLQSSMKLGDVPSIKSSDDSLQTVPSDDLRHSEGNVSSHQPPAGLVPVPVVVMRPSGSDTPEQSGVSIASGSQGSENDSDVFEQPSRSTAETPMSALYVSQPALSSHAALDHIVPDAVPSKPFAHVPKLDRRGFKLFEALPNFGTIPPGESHTVGFKYFAECGTRKECRALCKVKGGPNYTVKLVGGSAKTKYRLASKDIDCGLLHCGLTHSQHFGITNRGVGVMKFTIYPPKQDGLKMSEINFIPREGEVQANETFNVDVQITPGLPETAETEFGIRVMHHRREDIKIRWTGRFATFTVNLPRVVCVDYLQDVRQAQLSFEDQDISVSSHLVMDVMSALEKGERTTGTGIDAPTSLGYYKIAMANASYLRNLAPAVENVTSEEKSLAQVMFDTEIDRLYMHSYVEEMLTRGSPERPSLPERFLNVGAIKVNEPSETCFTALNGHDWPVTFDVLQQELKGTGFYVPPSSERTIKGSDACTLKVCYDPYRRMGWNGKGPKPTQSELEAALQSQCGFVSTRVLFDIPGHAYIVVRLEADLFMPSLIPATTQVQFQDTKIGECGIFTLLVSNPAPVELAWRLELAKPKMPKVDKFMPMHLRKKFFEENKPKMMFDVYPASGLLEARRSALVAVIFTPQEEKCYVQDMKLLIDGMSKCVDIDIVGKGLEPRLQFPTGTKTIGPTLPFDPVSTEIMVHNPCDYPVEFIATQFDQLQHLERQIIAWDNAFDGSGTMITPAREPGRGLPLALLKAYQAELKKIEESLAAAATTGEEARAEGSTLDVSSTVALAESSSSIGRVKSRSSSKQSTRDTATREKEKRKDKKEVKKEGKKEREMREAAEAEAAAAARAAELEAARLAAMSPLTRIQTSMASLGAGVVPPERKTTTSKPKHFSEVLLNEKLGLESGPTVMENALCTHVNVDTSEEGTKLRRTRGICVILHGAPGAGKSTQAEQLGKEYSCKVLIIDSVLRTAIDKRDSQGGVKASEFLINAKNEIMLSAQRELEAAQQAAAGKKGKPGSLKNKASSVSMAVSSGTASQPTRLESLTSPPTGATLGPLSPGMEDVFDPEVFERASMNRDDIFVPLSEDIAVEILQHRLQEDDCHLGVVFDGLETSILDSMAAAYRVIWRAVGDRHTVKLFDLFCDAEGFKERQMQQPFYEFTVEDQPVPEEPEVIPDWRTIEEDDYDALDEEMRRKVDAQQVADRREAKQIRLAQEAEERRLRELQEAEEKRLEEERLQKKKRKPTRLATGLSPSTSSANLGKKSRPGSGVRGLDTQESTRSILGGEAGRSRLTASMRTASSAVGLDKIPDSAETDGAGPEAETAGRKSTEFPDQRPGFSNYHKSRSMIQESMSLWDHEKLDFIPNNEEKEGSGSNITIQSVRRVLPRVKEAESIPEATQPTEDLRPRQLRPSALVRVTTKPHSVRNMSPRKTKRALSETSATMDYEQQDSLDRAGDEATTSTLLSSADPSTTSLLAAEDSPSEKKDAGPLAKASRKRKKRRRGSESEASATDITVESTTNADAQPAKDIVYHTIRLDDGQHIEDVTRHLLGHLPHAQEMRSLIPGGPGNPVPLLPATFQLIKRSAKEQATTSDGLPCFSIMAEPAPPPPPEPPAEAFAEATSESSSKPTSSEKGRRSPLDSGKRHGSTKSLRAVPEEGKKSSKRLTSRSPKPSRQSTRGSTSLDDDLAGRPSTDSLDHTSLHSAETKPQLTPVHRWVVQPKSSVAFHVHFNAERDATVDQVVSFQIVGSGRQYELFCRGTSVYPSITKNMHWTWPAVWPSYRPEEIARGVFIADQNTFDFGPLMVGRSHDRIREGIFPENTAKLKLSNKCGLDVRVDPSFENDTTSNIFLVEPKDLVIPNGATRELTLFAMPQTTNNDKPMIDNLRIAFNQNPRPMVYKVSCHGTEPMLHVEPKDFFFGKIVVGRSHVKFMTLSNNTRLPVGFRISGLDTLGEGFKLDNDHGIVEPFRKTKLRLSVKSDIPLQLKKSLRLEIYDAKQVIGLLHTENLPVVAEIYDVQVDIHYPRNMGIDTGDLEFGSCRVYEEQKLIANIRNKGKYAAEFQFHIDKKVLPDPKIADLFCLIPHKGILNGGEKPTSVVVTFCPDREVDLRHVPLFVCEIKDPNYHDSTKETLALVPVHVSARTVYSKFAVQPDCDLNFGTMILHTRREKKFTLMNKGEFEFKYTLFRSDGNASPMTAAANLRRKQMLDGMQEKNRRMRDVPKQVAQMKKDVLSKIQLDRYLDQQRYLHKAEEKRHGGHKRGKPSLAVDDRDIVLGRLRRGSDAPAKTKLSRRQSQGQIEAPAKPNSLLQVSKVISKWRNQAAKTKTDAQTEDSASGGETDTASRASSDVSDTSPLTLTPIGTPGQECLSGAELSPFEDVSPASYQESGFSLPTVPYLAHHVKRPAPLEEEVEEEPPAKREKCADQRFLERTVSSVKTSVQKRPKLTKLNGSSSDKIQADTHKYVLSANAESPAQSTQNSPYTPRKYSAQKPPLNLLPKVNMPAKSSTDQGKGKLEVPMHKGSVPRGGYDQPNARPLSQKPRKDAAQPPTSQPKPQSNIPPKANMPAKRSVSEENEKLEVSMPATCDAEAGYDQFDARPLPQRPGKDAAQPPAPQAKPQPNQPLKTNVPARPSVGEGGEKPDVAMPEGTTAKAGHDQPSSVKPVPQNPLLRLLMNNVIAELAQGASGITSEELNDEANTGVASRARSESVEEGITGNKDRTSDGTNEQSKKPNVRIDTVARQLLQRYCRPEGIVGQGSSSRLTIGAFTASPAMGAIPPGGQAVISVECHADNASCTEVLGIDISDRSPIEYPAGFPYKLLMEACTPGVEAKNFDEIFEEHTIVPSLVHIGEIDLQRVYSGRGTFCRDDRQFLFHNVFVGDQAKALLKIMNKTKLPCDVTLAIKGQTAKASLKLSEIFDIHPSKFVLEGKDMKFVTVTFSPQAIQGYNCTLDIGVIDPAVLASTASSRNIKSQCQFDICGEGVLPQFSVVDPRPSLKAKAAEGKEVGSGELAPTYLEFSRLLPERCTVKRITAKNDSPFKCTFEVRLMEKSEDGIPACFSLTQDMEVCSNVPDPDTTRLGRTLTTSRRVKVPTRMAARTNTPFKSMAMKDSALVLPHGGEAPLGSSRAVMTVDVEREQEFHINIKCSPKLPGRSKAELQIVAVGNQFETMRLHLSGEGYVDELSIPDLEEVANVSLAPSESTISLEKADKPVAGRKGEKKQALENHCCSLVDFGGVEVNMKKVVRFQISNHAHHSALKFQFVPPQSDVFTMSLVPKFGHIGAGKSKVIHATIVSSTPVCIKKFGFWCQTHRIQYCNQSLDDVENMAGGDWDEQCVVAKIVDAVSDLDGMQRDDGARVQHIMQLEEEPAHTVLEGTSRDIPFAFNLICDYAQYECPLAVMEGDNVPDVKFRDTAFYQARDTCIPVHNRGKVALRYRWSLVAEDGTEIKEGSQLSPPEDLYSVLLFPVGERQGMQSFFIHPAEGIVAAGETENFKATFRPILSDTATATMKCKFANVDPDNQYPLEVRFLGNGIVPLAHFDLLPSDYLTGGRRATEMLLQADQSLPAGAKLDVSTKVVEFTSHALQPVKREFRVSNPTSSPWKYEWQLNPITVHEAASAFKIDVLKGMVADGQRSTMSFEFSPASGRLLESFWNFCIPEMKLTVPFLLVGRVTEPAVRLTSNVINFGSTLKGRKVRRTLELVNDEDSYVEFAISDPAKKVEQHMAKVTISPRSGKVPPKSRMPVEVEVIVHVEKEISLNVSCKVKGMVKYLPLNIKADGYSVHVEGTIEIPSASGKPTSRPLENSAVANIIDFGKVQLNEKTVRVVSLYNGGRFPVSYRWTMSDECHVAGGEAHADLHSAKGKKRLITLKPQDRGTIEPSTSQRFTVAFCPGQKKVLSNCVAVCQVVYGPNFKVLFAGEGCKPSMHFSFRKHNFGPCFVDRTVMQSQRKMLTITNNHSSDISIKCTYHNSDHLSVDFTACVLQPGRSSEATIAFHPKTVGPFSADVLFEINGLSSTEVSIRGEGTIMKVEVADPQQKVIRMKQVLPHHTTSQTVKLVNRSLAALSFDVGLSPRATLEPGVITIKPNSDILLGPGASGNVVVTFAPANRMTRFSEEIYMDCAGTSMSLFTVTAACIAREVTLDHRRIAFGDIVLGSSTRRRIVMTNSGDLPSWYMWEASKFGPDFKIFPVEGQIEPKMEVTFTVECKPENVSKDIRYEDLRCRIGNADPLLLTLTAVCNPRSSTREPIQFNCHVRSKDLKTIPIKNNTTHTWTLRPVIDGHYWSGAESITVEPTSTRQYEILYKPVVMTSDGRKHQGSVFIALPDGNALYYTFMGTAGEPKLASAVAREWPCKREHIETFVVNNWLKTAQRFSVRIDVTKPDKPDQSTTIQGLDYLDVPASGKASYNLRFYAHREGMTVAKIVFRNTDTKEYVHYSFTVKSTSADIVESITLQTPVRQTLPYAIPVHNPLSSVVVFTTTVTSIDVSLPPQFTIPPHSDGECMLEYLPLKVGQGTAKLIFTSQELGTYAYELSLEAVLAPPEQALRFQAALGDKQAQTCHFTNYARSKTDYICKVDNPNFLVERVVSALAAGPGGTALSTDVTFEPQWLGETEGTVTIASSSGGEYQFPIKGTCIPPKPQGPFHVKAGVTTTIPFKNVFAKAAKFHFSLDNPLFTLRSSSDTIRQRKVHYIVVGFEGSGGGRQQQQAMPSNGTLTVTCTPESLQAVGLPDAQPMRWLFYLSGVLP